MTNLTRFDSNDLELLINEETGECFASISATARMCGNSHTTISRFATCASWVLLDAEVQTATGLKTCALLNEDQIFECFAKYNPELLLQCAKAGIRMYLYAIVNYSKPNKPITVDRQLPPVRDAIDYAHAMAAIAPMIDSRLKRLVEARMVADLSIDVVNQKQITAVAQPVKNYTTATVRAAQLGYSAKQIDSGTDLGKFVKKQIMPEFQDWQGQYKVNHFEVNDQLDSCIHAYFLTRSL